MLAMAGSAGRAGRGQEIALTGYTCSAAAYQQKPAKMLITNRLVLTEMPGIMDRLAGWWERIVKPIAVAVRPEQ